MRLNDTHQPGQDHGHSRSRRAAARLGAFAPLLLLVACAGQEPAQGVIDNSPPVPSGSDVPAGGGAGGGMPAMPGGNGGGPVDPTMPVTPPAEDCSAARAPIRRLTAFEYNNAVADLFGDMTSPGNSLAPETSAAHAGSLSNKFGNDAEELSVSDQHVERYANVAEGIATRATETPEALAKLDACGATVTEATEEACATAIITAQAPRIFRRPLEAGEPEALLALQKATRANGTFAESIASVLSGMLQSPDFLYRPELGVPDPADAGIVRPSDHEMATRLSFMLWGSTPDDTLLAAAAAGELSTPAQVLEQATRMLDDARSRRVFRHFFDNYLPITGLLTRDPVDFPTFNSKIASLFRQETHTFLEHEIFTGSGTWSGALSADYTFLNEELATFYGVEGVTGEEFQKAPLDTTQRLGLLTQAAFLAGSIPAQTSNPVTRGAFVIKNLMCLQIELPDDPALLAQAMAPVVSDAPTARERYSEHAEQDVCAGCHAVLDPAGFALENFDPVGLWRDQENGVTIDASGQLPGLGGPFDGPVELMQKLAESEAVHNCFARNWGNFAYGLTLGKEEACTVKSLADDFKASGNNIKQLLLSLTQTETFLTLPANRE